MSGLSAIIRNDGDAPGGGPLALIRQGEVVTPAGTFQVWYGGQGAPVMVLYQADRPAPSPDFLRFLGLLADDFRVVAPMLGDDVEAGIALAIATELGDETIRVLGVGPGALVGIGMAAAAPGRLEALVCVITNEAAPAAPLRPGDLAAWLGSFPTPVLVIVSLGDAALDAWSEAAADLPNGDIAIAAEGTLFGQFLVETLAATVRDAFW